MDFESVGRGVLGGAGLFDDIVVGGRVHLKNSIAFLRGALDLQREILGRCGACPGRHRHAVADLLPEEFVGRLFDGLAHRVVERPHQAVVEIGGEEVEGRAVDQCIDHLLG